MNIKLNIILLILWAGSQLNGQAKKVKVTLDKPIECSKKDYTLVFHDEFDGNQLDTEKWYTFYPYGPETSKDSCAFCRTHVSANIYRDENCQVKDGRLQLKSDKTSGEWFGKKMNYTSGMVYSKQIFNTYGKYEIRVKLPQGRQQWPAFWIFGWNTEIDIFEFSCNGPKQVEFSIHNWLTANCPNKNPSKGAPCYTSRTGLVDFDIDFSKDFHTFSMEYEPHMIKFYIDDIMVRYVSKYYNLEGKPINSCNLSPGKYLMEPSFPNFGEPVSVIANQSVCTNNKEKKEVFPNFMEIDYIRVYQRDIQSDLNPKFPNP